MARSVPALQFAAGAAAACLIASACGSTTETSVTSPTAPTRCQATLGVPSTNFGPTGGTGTVAVNVARECSWTATSTASWISITGGQEGQGEGTVTFRIGENADPSTRRASLSVAEQAVQLAQDAAPCRYSVAAGDTTAPAAGGDLSIDIRTHALCNWTVASPVPWMSTSPASGKGDGTDTRRRHGEYEPGAPIGGGHRCRAERHVVAGLEGSHAAPSCPCAARAGSARAGSARAGPACADSASTNPAGANSAATATTRLVHVPAHVGLALDFRSRWKFRLRFDVRTIGYMSVECGQHRQLGFVEHARRVWEKSTSGSRSRRISLPTSRSTTLTIATKPFRSHSGRRGGDQTGRRGSSAVTGSCPSLTFQGG